MKRVKIESYSVCVGHGFEGEEEEEGRRGQRAVVRACAAAPWEEAVALPRGPGTRIEGS